jgi:RNA polymerase sigma factor (sigma-70 family)
MVVDGRADVDQVDVNQSDADEAGLEGDPVPGWFAGHHLPLVRLALQLVDDRATAEDVVQDVFSAVSVNPGRVGDPLPYLRTAVLNRSRSVLRRRRTRRLFLAAPAPDDQPVPTGQVEAAEQTVLRRDRDRRVLAAVRRLPTRQREVVVLRHYEQLAVHEIAALLGITPAAVSSSLNRAMNTLSDRLGGDRD